jgi:hypothetical protein
LAFIMNLPRRCSTVLISLSKEHKIHFCKFIINEIGKNENLLVHSLCSAKVGTLNSSSSLRTRLEIEAWEYSVCRYVDPREWTLLVSYPTLTLVQFCANGTRRLL